MVLDNFLGLIDQSSYLAVFIASFVSSSSVFIPVVPFPSYLPVLVGIGIGLNPLLVGVAGGVGSSLGELIGYLVGLGSSVAIEKFEKKVPKFLKVFEKFYSNIGFFVILFFAFFPFPFDVVGILSGASKYNFRRFLIALLIGRLTRSLLIAYAGYAAIPLVYNLFS